MSSQQRQVVQKRNKFTGKVVVDKLWEMGCGVSNGHVTSDIMWPWKVKVYDINMPSANYLKKWLEMHTQLWLHVTLKVKVIVIYLDWDILKNVRDSIGQSVFFGIS